MSFIKDLNLPLIKLSQSDKFDLADAFAGVHIFGGIGSGKTSGSGRMMAGAYLRAGMGGLVTAVKPEEIERWQRYAADHRRAQSVILLDSNEGFNFLAYELGRQGMEGIGAVTECFMRVLEAAKRASPTASQKGEEPFWENATRMCLRYAIPLIYSATGTLQIADLIRIISTAPTHPKEVVDPAYQKRAFMYQIMEAAANNPKVPMEQAALQDAITYWAQNFPAIPDKTKGNIVITVTTTLDRFMHGRLNRTFCGRTTVVPEMTFHGAIIVLAMPTLTWNEDGIIAQQLFKYMWQRAVLSRNGLPQVHRERPVFLFSDEAQETVNSYDGEFLSMCRESKCCVTYLTQSLPTYYAKMGGDNPRDAAQALVGKFNTHIYHSNACPETNEYASRMIGKVTTRRANYSAGTSKTVNSGMSVGDSNNSGSSSTHGSSGGHAGFAYNYGSNSGRGHNWGDNRNRGQSQNESEGYSEYVDYAIQSGDLSVRVSGSRAGVCLILIACTLMVDRWYEGYVSGWIALLAGIIALQTLGAVRKMRRYKAWLAEWNAMSGTEQPKPKDRGPIRRRALLTGIALILVGIPVCIPYIQDNDGLFGVLTLLWLAACICLLGLGLRRFMQRKTQPKPTEKAETGAAVVERMLGRASSSPSRSEAARKVPDYCTLLCATRATTEPHWEKQRNEP